MAFDVNSTIRGQPAMDSKRTSSSQAKTSSNFPVIPVAVVSGIVVAALILILVLYAIRRRNKERYHDYTPISKPNMVNTVLRDTSATRNKISSDDHSLTATSSDGKYNDEDEFESKSISTRDSSPVQTEIGNTYPEDHIGRLWFTASYDSNQECLTVVLKNIENLPNRSATVRSCDPSVQISLLPSHKKVAHSKYKRKNKNPVFNETFEINLPSFDLSKTTLCLTVIDGYRANQQSTVGQVLYPLKDLHHYTEVQKDIIKHTESSSVLGQLHVSLSYYPTLHRLTAIILRATNLKRSNHRPTDSYVKVSFSIGNKVMKTKKTAVHTDTQSPMFNESFDFMVNEDDLGSSTLMISVMHSGSGLVEDKLIGRVLLGGRMYARGRACDHWIDMMNNTRKMAKCWHELQGC